MVNPVPFEHIVDAHKLTADGDIDLFELSPASGSGVLRFKADNDVNWRGNLYAGLPLQFATDGTSTDKGSDLPKMIIGQPNIDLSLFKPLIFDGGLDGATIVRYSLLLTNLINNASIYERKFYRVKRVEGYDRTSVTLQLASLSDSLAFSLPFRQYIPPDFPSVQL